MGAQTMANGFGITSRFLFILTLLTLPQIAEATSFDQMCQTKAKQTPEAQYTIVILLKKAGSTDCGRAEKTLRSLKVLALNDMEISDLSPLASLTELKTLSLWNNRIANLRPIMSLTNLESLNLGENRIVDLSPLSNLLNLKKLWLDSNKVTTLAAIGLNHRLEILSVKDNLLTDISPRDNLWRLQHFDSSLNPTQSDSALVQ